MPHVTAREMSTTFRGCLALCAALVVGTAAHAQGLGGSPLTQRGAFESCLDATLRALGGEATHAEFESSAGIPTYEFVVRSGEVLYNAGCDAHTGMISRVDVIVEASDTRWTDVAKIDETTARNAAIERFPGGEVEEIKRLLMGDGRVAYEVDLKFKGQSELNVYVDAVVGGIFLVNTEEWEIGGRSGTAAASVNQAAVCRDGIAAIEAALARNPAPDQREPLERARRRAVNEQAEQELDECLEAINRVRPMLTQP